jgi:hypothetical protein
MVAVLRMMKGELKMTHRIKSAAKEDWDLQIRQYIIVRIIVSLPAGEGHVFAHLQSQPCLNETKLSIMRKNKNIK